MKAKAPWRNWRVLSIALRVLVAAGLLGLVLWRLDLSEVVAVVSSLNLSLLLVALLIAIVAWILPALAWGRLAAALDLKVTAGRLILFQYMGTFFNNFAPSNLGGDVARAYFLSRWTSRFIESSVTVVVLKMITIATLLAMAVVAAIYAREMAGARLVLGSLLILLAAGLVVGAGIILLRKYLGNSNSQGWVGRIAGRIGEIWRSLLGYRRHPWALAGAFGYLALFHSMNILVPYTIGRAMSVEVELLSFFLFIPMIRLFTMLPVSLNGLGVREGAFVVFFTQVGLTPAAAFSLSLLQYLITTLASLPGGLLYLTGSGGVRRDK